jgi:hypothetical protein
MANQTTLLPDESATESAVRPSRTTSKTIGPGDIVEIDKRGRRFHAIVQEIDQSESGRFNLEVQPIERGITFRQATVREVVAVWRKAR